MARAGSHVPRRGAFEDDIVLGVLDAVERDPAMTQRAVARELGIALGLANAYLKRCVGTGLIKVGRAPPRRHVYHLTAQGCAEKSRLTATCLTDSLASFREARTQCSELLAAALARGQRRLVLLGDGDLAEIASLVAHEYPVEIAGVLDATSGSDRLAASVNRLGRVDAALVTAVLAPRESFEAALVVFGPERVHAPALLRLHKHSVESAPGEVASIILQRPF